MEVHFHALFSHAFHIHNVESVLICPVPKSRKQCTIGDQKAFLDAVSHVINCETPLSCPLLSPLPGILGFVGYLVGLPLNAKGLIPRQRSLLGKSYLALKWKVHTLSCNICRVRNVTTGDPTEELVRPTTTDNGFYKQGPARLVGNLYFAFPHYFSFPFLKAHLTCQFSCFCLSFPHTKQPVCLSPSVQRSLLPSPGNFKKTMSQFCSTSY